MGKRPYKPGLSSTLVLYPFSCLSKIATRSLMVLSLLVFKIINLWQFSRHEGSIFYFISFESCLKRKSVLTFENCFNLKRVIVTHKKAVICTVVTHMRMDNRDLKDNNSYSTSIHFSVDAEGL